MRDKNHQLADVTSFCQPLFSGEKLPAGALIILGEKRNETVHMASGSLAVAIALVFADERGLMPRDASNRLFRANTSISATTCAIFSPAIVSGTVFIWIRQCVVTLTAGDTFEVASRRTVKRCTGAEWCVPKANITIQL